MIVQAGDLMDFYSASKFPRSYNLFTPREEVELSRNYSIKFWSILNKYCPKAEKYQILGNHCVRPIKRIMEKAPEFEEDMKRSLNELYTFEGVKTIYDTHEELVIDDVWYHHGHRSKLGDHASYNHQNTVCGHTHRGGAVFFPLEGHLKKQIWEANAGYLANPHAAGLRYTMQNKATRWTHGVLEIDQFGPKFVALWPEMAKGMENDPLFKELVFE